MLSSQQHVGTKAFWPLEPAGHQGWELAGPMDPKYTLIGVKNAMNVYGFFGVIAILLHPVGGMFQSVGVNKNILSGHPKLFYLFIHA